MLTNAEIHSLAWRILGDPNGAGIGWIGYGRDHAMVSKGIRAGINAVKDKAPHDQKKAGSE
jgi:hypothetical protein